MVDYKNIAFNLDKNITQQWDTLVDEAKNLFLEHCKNTKELDAFYEELCKIDNLGGLTTDVLATAYERLSDEWWEPTPKT